MRFIEKERVLAIHRRALEEFGGTGGVRDEGALDSALMAPINRYHYEGADVVVCAAAYAYHLTQAHAFVDGNKRVAAVVTETFLILNGAQLTASDDALESLFLGIASGSLSRAEVESQLRPWVVGG